MAVCNFPVATSESWNDKDGQKQERTEWHRIVVWGKLGELCERYLRKGRKAYVEGRLQTRSWEDKEGQKRYTTEIVATTVQFLDSAASSERAPAQDDPFGAPPSFDQGGGGATDDIPF